jgi:uncharacterized protein YcbX
LENGETDHYSPTLARIDADITRYRGEIQPVIYPFKALAGIEVDEAIVGTKGLKTPGGFRDRSGMFVRFNDNSNQWHRFTQREEAGLAQVTAELVDENTLQFLSPGGAQLRCSAQDFEPQDGTVIRAATYKDQYVEGQMERIDGPFTQFIHQHLASLKGYTTEKLQRIGVLLPHIHVDRSVPASHSGGPSAKTEFADIGKFLLINAATVDYVNEGIDPPVPAEAYRGNIIVKNGWPANLEDFVEQATLGSGEQCNMHFGVMSTRCIVTKVDPHTGIKRTDGQPIDALMKRRPLREKQPTMGINVANRIWSNEQVVRKGDIITPNTEKLDWEGIANQ